MKIKLVQAENYRLGLLKSPRSLFSPFPLERGGYCGFQSHTRLLKMRWGKRRSGNKMRVKDARSINEDVCTLGRLFGSEIVR